MLFCGLLFIWSLFSLTELELVFSSVLFPGLLSVCGLFEVEEFCDLKDVVLIDNSVLSFEYHLDNGIQISPFYDSKVDM